MFGDEKMTTKCAPVSVTAHICKAVGSMNQKIHHTRLQLLAKDFFFLFTKGIQENREYFIEHPRQLYFHLLCSQTFSVCSPSYLAHLCDGVIKHSSGIVGSLSDKLDLPGS